MKKNNKENHNEELKKEFKIFLAFILIVLTIIITIYVVRFGVPDFNKLFKDNNKKELSSNIELTENIKIPENIKYETLDKGLKFVCSNYIYYNNTKIYDPGSDVYCDISFELPGDSNIKIKEIWGEFSHDDDIEYKEIYEVWEEWNLKQKDNEFNLVTSNPSNYAEGFYKLKFKIKPSTKKEELNIYFKNIIVKSEDNKYYKFNDNTINLKIKILTNYKYEKDEKNNELVFYKFNDNVGYEEVSRYKCEYDECEFPTINASGTKTYYDYEKGKALIYDGHVFEEENSYYKKIIIYDFNNGILKSYNNIKKALNITEYKEEKLIYKYLILVNNNDEMSLIDIEGRVLKDFSNNKFTLSCYEGCLLANYSLDDDMIVTIKDSKYGIEKFYSNEIIIEHIYDEIALGDMINVTGYYEETKSAYDNKYFRAKINNKWYLYSFETKEKVTDGYDALYLIDADILLVKIDNNLYLKNLKGDNITEETINLEYGLLPFYPKVPEGISVSRKKDVITITIVDGNYENYLNHKYKTYEFNVKTNELKKLDN